MTHVKNDKRSQRTSEVLYISLAKLLESRNFADINVSTLVRKAQIGRSSFYRNFDTIEDVFSYQCEKEAEDFYQAVTERKDDIGSFLLTFFSYWTKNTSLLVTLKKADRIDILFNALKKNPFLVSPLSAADRDRGYLSMIYLGSLITTLSCWIDKGEKETPTQLASIVKQSLPLNRESILTQI